MCQLNLANKIPKLILPTSDPEDKSKEVDTELDNFPPSQADLDDHDLGLTFEKVRAHQILVQGFGEDPEHDMVGSQIDLTNLKFVPNFTQREIKSKETL